MPRPRTPKGRARETFDRLGGEYPGTVAELCELDFASPFHLLVATILSAQTTDVRVNSVTPLLFARWPDAAALAGADIASLEDVHDGEVPTALADLVRLPGVGRKTANVIRSVAFDLPGLPVDTHVLRLSVRLGLTEETDPVRVEHALGALVPGRHWGLLSERLILHGRRVCDARRPRCDECVLQDFCPSAFLAGRR